MRKLQNLLGGIALACMLLSSAAANADVLENPTLVLTPSNEEPVEAITENIKVIVEGYKNATQLLWAATVAKPDGTVDNLDLDSSYGGFGGCWVVIPNGGYTAPGTYTFTIPAGSMKVGTSSWSPANVEVGEITFSYTIAGEEPEPEPSVAVELTPSNAEPLAALTEKIKVVVTGYKNATQLKWDATVEKPDGTVDDLELDSSYGGFGGCWVLLPAGGYTAPGTYNFTIPAGTLKVGTSSWSSPDTEVGEIRFSYVVSGETPTPFEFVVDPSATLVKEIAGVFTITFPLQATDGVYLPSTGGKAVKVTGPNDASYTYTLSMGDKVNEVKFNVTPAITESGEYNFVIPEGTLANNETEEILPEVAFAITVDNSIIVDPYTVEPDLNGKALQGKYTVTLNEYTSIAWDSDMKPQRVYMYKGGKIFKANDGQDYNYYASASGNVITFTAEPPLAYEGDYELNIAGYVDSETGEEIPEYYIPFHLDGDESLQPEKPEEPKFDPYYVLEPDNSVEYKYLSGNILIVYPNVDFFNSVGGFATITLPSGDVLEYQRISDGAKINRDNAGYIALSKTFEDEGTYTFNIPARVFENKEGVYNEAFQFTYTVSANGVVPGEDPEVTYDTTIDPEEGEYEELSSFTITFNGVNRLSLDETAGPSQFPHLYTVKEDGIETVIGNVYLSSETNGNTVTISIVGGKYDIEGKYALVLPANGQLLVDGEPLKSAVKFYYTISPSETFEWGYVLDPDPAEKVINPKNFTMTFTGVSSIERQSLGSSIPYLYLLDDEGARVSACHLTFSNGADGKSFIMTLYYPIEQEGRYELYVPANYVLLHSEENPDVTMYNTPISVFYELGLKEQEFDGTISVERKDDSFKAYHISFLPQANTADLNEDVTEPIEFQTADEDCLATATINKYDENQFDITFESLPNLEPGTYYIMIPAGKFIVDGAKTKVHYAEVKVETSSIIDINADAAKGGIISLDGTVISRNADAETVRSLTPGFYIINGKKAFIR